MSKLLNRKKRVYIVLGFGPGDVTHILKVHSREIVAFRHAQGLNGNAADGYSYTYIEKSIEGSSV